MAGKKKELEAALKRIRELEEEVKAWRAVIAEIKRALGYDR